MDTSDGLDGFPVVETIAAAQLNDDAEGDDRRMNPSRLCRCGGAGSGELSVVS